MKTKKTNTKMAAIEQFNEFTSNMVAQTSAWVRKMPAKRTALLFFCDTDAEIWQCSPLEYQTGKRKRYRLLLSLFGALTRNDKLYEKAENLMRNVKRQRKRDAREKAAEEAQKAAEEADNETTENK